MLLSIKLCIAYGFDKFKTLEAWWKLLIHISSSLEKEQKTIKDRKNVNFLLTITQIGTMSVQKRKHN